MKARTLILIVVAFSLASIAAAQTRHDYAGEWFGYITQEPAGLASRYTFELELEATDDGLKGEAHISMEEQPEIFGVMAISGNFEEAGLLINEEIIVSQRMYTFGYWCMKSYRLRATWVNGILILEGNWTSDACGDGDQGFIHLERRLS